jgi:hypothetical protein
MPSSTQVHNLSQRTVSRTASAKPLKLLQQASQNSRSIVSSTATSTPPASTQLSKTCQPGARFTVTASQPAAALRRSGYPCLCANRSTEPSNFEQARSRSRSGGSYYAYYVITHNAPKPGLDDWIGRATQDDRNTPRLREQTAETSSHRGREITGHRTTRGSSLPGEKGYQYPVGSRRNTPRLHPNAILAEFWNRRSFVESDNEKERPIDASSRQSSTATACFADGPCLCGIRHSP